MGACDTPGTSTVLGYFIGFPCMRIAPAIICIWFLRPWKWICRMVLAWDVLILAPAIVLLEWHCMIGMFGGIATAFLAIWIAGWIQGKDPHGEEGGDFPELAAAGKA